jgi:hypothetical protein
VKNYSYEGFIPTLAKELVASMGSIRAEHGFGLGPEFETIPCKLLRQALASQYGICRGYLTNSKGEVAGDYTGPLFPIKVIGNPHMLIGVFAIFQEHACVPDPSPHNLTIYEPNLLFKMVLLRYKLIAADMKGSVYEWTLAHSNQDYCGRRGF